MRAAFGPVLDCLMHRRTECKTTILFRRRLFMAWPSRALSDRAPHLENPAQPFEGRAARQRRRWSRGSALVHPALSRSQDEPAPRQDPRMSTRPSGLPSGGNDPAGAPAEEEQGPTVTTGRRPLRKSRRSTSSITSSGRTGAPTTEFRELFPSPASRPDRAAQGPGAALLAGHRPALRPRPHTSPCPDTQPPRRATEREVPSVHHTTNSLRAC